MFIELEGYWENAHVFFHSINHISLAYHVSTFKENCIWEMLVPGIYQVDIADLLAVNDVMHPRGLQSNPTCKIMLWWQPKQTGNSCLIANFLSLHITLGIKDWMVLAETGTISVCRVWQEILNTFKFLEKLFKSALNQSMDPMLGAVQLQIRWKACLVAVYVSKYSPLTDEGDVDLKHVKIYNS